VSFLLGEEERTTPRTCKSRLQFECLILCCALLWIAMIVGGSLILHAVQERNAQTEAAMGIVYTQSKGGGNMR
jgi:hypothetical protein